MPSFDLETVQAENGTVTVTGRWHGVRGRRFMRPSLTPVGNGGGTRLLADLEHKPWSAEDGEPWVAMFSWDGALDKAEALELAVAPDVVVRIPPPGAKADKEAPPPKTGAGRKRLSAAAERDAARAERDAALTERDAALAERDAALAEREKVRAERDAAREERDRTTNGQQEAEARADDLARQLESALAERDRLVEEADEARGRIERLTREVERARDQAEAARIENEKMSALVADQEVRWREAQVRADRVSGERDNALKDAAVLTARVKELEGAEQSRSSATEEMHRQLETVEKELAQTRDALKEANRAPAPLALNPTERVPGLTVLSPPVRRGRLDWSASPQARIVALGAFVVVLIVVLIIVVGH